MTPARHPTLGRFIDRDRPVTFAFNGKTYQGFAGDTLASALLANNIHLIGRSFKYHRPRGIVGAGVEEPNALVRLLAPRREPLTLATTLTMGPGLRAVSVNCWPGPAFDTGAILGWFHHLLPAGFYYKTFMGPTGAWPLYEKFIRRFAGLGVAEKSAPKIPLAANQRRRFAHCDILIVGAGPAGTAAAAVAARSGATVLLVDDQIEPGGTLQAESDSDGILGWIGTQHQQLRSAPNVRCLFRTRVSGFYEHGFLTAHEQLDDAGERLWKIRAQRVILATGALERPLIFPENDRPGVMLASAVQSYLLKYGVVCGQRVVLVSSNNSGYHVAFALAGHGIVVAAIVDTRESINQSLLDQAKALGIKVLIGHTITTVHGRKRIGAVQVAPIRKASIQERPTSHRIDCDLVAMAGGWSPLVHLHSQSGGSVVYDAERVCFMPGKAVQNSHCAGAINGLLDTGECISEGAKVGYDALEALGYAQQNAVQEFAPPPSNPVATLRNQQAQASWNLPVLPGQRAFVDFANDVTSADLALAQREGYESVELVKRYTTTGMGPDQGRTANVNAIGVLAQLRGISPGQVGTTTFRPPYAPVAFGAIAGGEGGAVLRPKRSTPMTNWHESHGAVMYESGANWRRPGYYPLQTESMAAAVARECLAVRQAAGIYDSTPLGKIEVRGESAGDFLEFVGTGNLADLAVHRGRYGLMLREDGRLLDDGVIFKLAPDHYWVSTTSGNADTVAAWLEYLRQRVWRAEVFVVPVTTQWANAVVCGPHSRRIIDAVGTDIELDGNIFPFMSMREGKVAGLPARVFRVSFTGELSYEINVRARDGLALWQALWAAGRPYGLEAVGSEANHVLRIEKGYISIGHEADGMASPDDLGLGWAVKHRKADFIGKRSLAIHHAQPGQRRQLIGLLTDDPDIVIAEGAQILSQDTTASAGHVTASVMSGTLGRSIALGLLDSGRDRIGETVQVTVAQGKGLARTSALVTPPVFYDKSGEALRA